MRRPARRPPALAVVLAVALVAAGCGKSDEPTAAPPEPQPTAKATDFPSARGRSATDVRAGAAEGPVLAPSVSVVDPGRNRFGFAIFDTARKQIPGAQVAIYTARVDGTGARGPYLARSESLEVKPQFRSRTTTSDPDSAKAVYVADVPFGPRGTRAIWAMVRLDGRMLYTNAFSINVGRAAAGGETGARLAPAGTLPPRVGDRAIRVHTQTARLPRGPNGTSATYTALAESGSEVVVLLRNCGLTASDSERARYGPRAPVPSTRAV